MPSVSEAMRHDAAAKRIEAVRLALHTLECAGDRRVNLWSEQPPMLLFPFHGRGLRGERVSGY